MANVQVVSSTEIIATTAVAISSLIGVPSDVRVYVPSGNSNATPADLFTYLAVPEFIVSVLTDDAAGIPANCPNQNATPAPSGPNCSLRDAVAAANAQPAGTASVITFANNLGSSTTPGTITLTNGQLSLTQSMTITGLGTSALLIDGNNASGILLVNIGVTASISNLTMQHARGTGNNTGGAIDNAGTLTLTGGPGLRQ